MATWNPDDYMLTLKGEEVLSKVLVGIDKLTISRIVTGAGFVSSSQLYRQTEVTNPQQEMTISSVETTNNGSEIVVRVTNKGVTTSYPIYQIGVYVTHPDFEGEVLYMIAQCDTRTPDYMPTENDTPVSLTYSLYVAHSGTDNISVTVSDAGFLPSTVFYDFKTNITNMVANVSNNLTAISNELNEKIAAQNQTVVLPSAGYYKIAEREFTEPDEGAYIAFYMFPINSAATGVFHCEARTADTSQEFATKKLVWEYANAGVATSYYTLVSGINSEGNSTIEIWAKTDASVGFKVLTDYEEATWKIFNSPTKQSNFPSGAESSTLLPIINPVTIPVVSSDPTNPRDGEVWIVKNQ